MAESIVKAPEVTLNIVSSDALQGLTPQKVLLLGQMTTGSATSGELVENLPNGAVEIDALFGQNSQIGLAAKAFKRLNDFVQIDAIPLDDDGGATAATGSIAFTGAATSAGTFEVIVGSQRRNKYTIAVAEGDTADDIGAALEAAITADDESLVTAVNTTGSVALTAVNGGTCGNDLALISTGIVAGVSVTATAMAGGATDPDVSGVFDVVGDERYQNVIWQGSWDLTELTDFLDPRFNATNAVLDGVGIVNVTDTAANIITKADAENSQSLVILSNKNNATATHVGGGIAETDLVISAQFAAIRSLRLSDSANISRFVTSTASRDQFGGGQIAALPYHNTPFPDLFPIKVGKGFTASEMTQLNTAGASVLGNNTAGNTVIAGTLVTTYKTDNAGNPDPSFKFLNFVDSSSVFREFQVNNLRATYAQTRATNGDLIEGLAIANPPSVRAFIKRLYKLQSQDGVVQAGAEPEKFFDENLKVSLDIQTGTFTISEKFLIVGQARRFIGTVQIAFSTEE